MRLFILSAAILLPLAPALGAPPGSPPWRDNAVPRPVCPYTAAMERVRSWDKATMRRLTDLPPANAYAAVLRVVGECESPIVVKYGVGAVVDQTRSKAGASKYRRR